MPLVTEMVHPQGLSFAMQRKAFVLRNVKKMSWEEVQQETRNLQGDPPSIRTLQRCS